MRIAHSATVLVLLAGLAASGVSAAPNTISYSNKIDPPIVVTDDVAPDLDPDPDEIRVAFTLVDPGGDWTASGEILATTTDPEGATLVVTDTEIRNVTGNQILGAMIEVIHSFDPIVDFVGNNYKAHLSGEFDKIGAGPLGNLILNNSVFLNGAVLVDAFNVAGGLVDPPITFNETTQVPVHLDTVISQSELFIFYIDELDNVIELHDSATVVPDSTLVPGVVGFWAAGLAAALAALGTRRLRAAP